MTLVVPDWTGWTAKQNKTIISEEQEQEAISTQERLLVKKSLRSNDNYYWINIPAIHDSTATLVHV